MMHYQMMRRHVVMMKDEMMGQEGGRRDIMMVYDDMMMKMMVVLMMMLLMLLMMLGHVVMMLELYGHVVWLHAMVMNHDMMRRKVVMMVYCCMIQVHYVMMYIVSHRSSCPYRLDQIRSDYMNTVIHTYIHQLQISYTSHSYIAFAMVGRYSMCCNSLYMYTPPLFPFPFSFPSPTAAFSSSSICIPTICNKFGV